MAKTSSEESRKSFLDEIMNKIQNVLTLEIKTVVCELEVTQGSTEKSIEVVPSKSKPATEAIVSRIKLLEGDIDCIMTKEFAAGEYKSLREFHQLKESQAQEIVRKNIEIIKTIVTAISKDFKNG